MFTLLTQASAAAESAGGIDPKVWIAAAVGVVGAVLLVRFRMKRGAPTTRTQSGDRDAAGPMFGTLLASKPSRDISGMTGSAVSSLVVHAMVIGGLVWATMAVGEAVEEEEVITIIEMIEEVPPPPPPPPPVNVEEPIAPIDVAKGFMTLSIPEIVPPEIPPPQVGVVIREEDFSGLGREGGRADGREGAPTLDDLLAAPVFTPYTVKPELLNGPEVTSALVRFYPPLLRDAGIGGRTLMWFFIDETGKVLKTEIKETSGYGALDETAERVATLMKFSPALNRDRKVQVWIEIPIVFTAR